MIEGEKGSYVEFRQLWNITFTISRFSSYDRYRYDVLVSKSYYLQYLFFFCVTNTLGIGSDKKLFLFVCLLNTLK